MAHQTITPEALATRLGAGPDQRITWVIGAGFSAASGIPLAEGIATRLLLYEFLRRHNRQAPWMPTSPSRLSRWERAPVQAFLEWFQDIPADGTQSLLIAEAETWLASLNTFEGLGANERYSRLFDEFLDVSLPEARHIFVTELMRLAKGPNLAHDALAYILLHQPQWGRTVFTTNFDDLLLQALVSVAAAPRIYGDLDSKDQPTDNQNYPQIVHLHGRHTG
ncbi:MAG: hypothetical protein O3B84_07925, partial [Chloroflexi bacterium]|nr:hypothetical protein [Chloroflexota bacterium]